MFRVERLFVAAAALLLGAGLIAPKGAFAGVEVGVTGWNTRPSGYVYSPQQGGKSNTVDFRTDLGMERHVNGGVHFILTHDLPLLPDIRLGYTHIMTDGVAYPTSSFSYQGVTYAVSGTVRSQAQLKDGRIVLFWNPLDNFVFNLRVGLEARWLSLNVPISGTALLSNGQLVQTETSAGAVTWLPLANVGFTVHLPAGFDVRGDGSYVSYSSNYLLDARLGFDYHPGYGVILSLGYRRLELRLNDSSFSVNGDMKFEGVYAGIGFGL